MAQRLAAAEIRAALTGVVPDPAAIIDDINVARYVADDGTVDADAVAQLRARFAALAPAKPAPANVPTGARGGDPVTFTRAQLRAMTPKEYAANEQAIQQAMREGRITE